MKIVTNAGDDQRRQVVPADFSFLSAADSDVVQGIALVLGRMFGLGASEPLSLGVGVVRRQVGDYWRYGLSDGVILKGGTLYKVEGLDQEFTFDHMLTRAEMRSLTDGYYLQFGQEWVSPSPVYKYGEGTVYCHAEAKITGLSTEADAESVRISDLRTLPLLGGLGYVYRVTDAQAVTVVPLSGSNTIIDGE